MAAHVSTAPKPVRIDAGGDAISGDLTLPDRARGLVLFAHGSGSGRTSSRNRAVADVMVKAQLGTLLVDLLTETEERIDHVTAELRFDIPLLTQRVVASIDWASNHQVTAALPIGLFGASTGAAAALTAAAKRADLVRAVVSRGGRPDLAGNALDVVMAPTLLIVGSRDPEVLALNRRALTHLSAIGDLQIVPGATHLFEEPGALDTVARMATDWFVTYLVA